MINMRTFFIFALLLLPLCAFGINVNITNAKLILDTTDSYGNATIAASCKLEVSGIRGKDFKLMAFVQDENGKWHKDKYGNTVKSERTLNATYNVSTWDKISVHIPHSKLAPSSGTHNYSVYLYVHYNNDFHGGVFAGSYSLTGQSSNSNHSSNTSNNNHNHSQDHSITVACQQCNGTGLSVCTTCHGAGSYQTYRVQTYYPWASYYETIACSRCNQTGKIKCDFCDGSGRRPNYNNSNIYNGGGYYNGGGGYNNGSSGGYNSGSSDSRCSICGGSGVCSSCNGRGGSWQDTGYYIGEDSKSWIPCPSCNGSKQCFNCYGRGRL